MFKTTVITIDEETMQKWLKRREIEERNGTGPRNVTVTHNGIPVPRIVQPGGTVSPQQS